jgi:hypothetical protein
MQNSKVEISTINSLMGIFRSLKTPLGKPSVKLSRTWLRKPAKPFRKRMEE